jgi:hypothetical protein
VYAARTFPENPEELLQEYDKALVNVKYAGSTYSKTMATALVIQDEAVIIGCYIQCDAMKGVGGGYRLLEGVKKALLGYKPTEGKNKLVLNGYADWFVEQGQVWPMIEFLFETVNMQAVDNTPESTTIDSEGEVTGGGPLTEVDSELYE